MIQSHIQREHGQSMVIIALLIVTMLIFSGLLVDGGSAYAARREVQNAADAGAFAGARELAARKVPGAPGSGLDDTAIARRINEYVERNGVPDSNGVPYDAANTNVRRRYIDKDGNDLGLAQDIGQVGSVPVAAVGVRVVPSINVPTFFMGIVGVNQTTAVAEAEAMMGAAGSTDGSGVFPVTVDIKVFDNKNIGDTITIWDDDPVVAPGAQRGWLNLNYVYAQTDPNSRTVAKNHSNNDLKGWCCNGYGASIYAGTIGGKDGDFINGDPGTRASTIQEAECRLNQVVIIPLYDATYSSAWMSSNCTPEPNIGWVGGSGHGGGLMYHIVAFAAVRITQINHQGSDKYIKAQFVGFVSTGGVNPGSNLPPEVVQTIGLTR